MLPSQDQGGSRLIALRMSDKPPRIAASPLQRMSLEVDISISPFRYPDMKQSTSRKADRSFKSPSCHQIYSLPRGKLGGIHASCVTFDLEVRAETPFDLARLTSQAVKKRTLPPTRRPLKA